MLRGLKGLFGCASADLKGVYGQIGQINGLFLAAQVLPFKCTVVEAVEEEVHKIRHDAFRALGFKELDDVVVCKRREFYEDLSDDSDSRLSFSGTRELVKVLYYIL